jgi:hypothetical protein
MLVCVSSRGSSRLTPVSVDIDQLLCLPEPLTPATAFRAAGSAGHGARPPSAGFHHQHLVIGGDVGTLKDRGNFVLTRGHFVVTCLDRHAEFVQPRLGLAHEVDHALGNRPK